MQGRLEKAAALLDLDPVAEGGVRWVPYIEGGRPEAPHEVEQDVPGGVPSSGAAAASARPTTQSLLKRARAMVARRTSEQPE